MEEEIRLMRPAGSHFISLDAVQARLGAMRQAYDRYMAIAAIAD